MTELRYLERRFQEAVAQNLIQAYKTRHSGWIDQPAIKKAILIDALFSWQSLACLTITAVTACLLMIVLQAGHVVSVLTLLIIVGLGLSVNTVWIWITFHNEKLQNKAIADLLGSEELFSLDTIRDKRVRVKLFKALRYWAVINETAHTVLSGNLNDRIETTVHEVTSWLCAIYNLAQRTDQLSLNPVFQRDLRSIPAVIQSYEQQLQQTEDSQLYNELELTLENQRHHHQSLQSLQDKIKQTHRRLDHTVAAMGMVHSQLLLITDRSINQRKSDHLQVDIAEEIDSLQELTEAMTEVYQSSITHSLL